MLDQLYDIVCGIQQNPIQCEDTSDTEDLLNFYITYFYFSLGVLSTVGAYKSAHSFMTLVKNAFSRRKIKQEDCDSDIVDVKSEDNAYTQTDL